MKNILKFNRSILYYEPVLHRFADRNDRRDQVLQEFRSYQFFISFQHNSLLISYLLTIPLKGSGRFFRLKLPGKLREPAQCFIELGICRNIIIHLTVIELLICHKIEISGSGETEEDCLLLTCLFTLLCFIYGNLDSV